MQHEEKNEDDSVDSEIKDDVIVKLQQQLFDLTTAGDLEMARSRIEMEQWKMQSEDTKNRKRVPTEDHQWKEKYEAMTRLREVEKQMLDELREAAVLKQEDFDDLEAQLRETTECKDKYDELVTYLDEKSKDAEAKIKDLLLKLEVETQHSSTL